MNTPPAEDASRSRVTRRLRHAAGMIVQGFRDAFVHTLLVLVLLAGTVVLGSWIVLHAVIVPRLDEWRPDVQAQATRALGVPVRLGAIELVGRTLMPRIVLRDVQLLDAQGRAALHLPRVDAVLSLASLWPAEGWRWHVVFQHIEIVAPVLELRRAADGRLQLAGVDLSGATAQAGEPAGPGLQWLLAQPSFRIRDGTLRWVDERDRAADPPGTRRASPDFTGVDLRVLQRGRTHQLQLDVDPPPAWGERFSVRAQWRLPLGLLDWATRRPGDLAQATGTVFADLPRVDIARLREQLDLPGDARSGAGAMRVWLDVREGRIEGATADLALHDLDVRLQADLPRMVLGTVSGRVQGRRDGEGLEMAGEQLAFDTTVDDAKGKPVLVHWPAGDWRLRWSPGQWGQPDAGSFEARRLDLAVLAQLAGRVPLAPGLRESLASWQPRGLMQDLSLEWQGPWQAPVRYAASGRVEALHLAPAPAAAGVGRPGVRGADVRWVATEAGGTASVGITQGSLSFPGVFEEAEVPLDSLNAELGWTVRPPVTGTAPALEVRVRELRVANADAQGQFRATWRTGPGHATQPGRGARWPGRLELSGTLARADGARVWRYLPLAIGQEVRHYVRDAVVASQASDVRVQVQGDLWDFPFADGPADAQAGAPGVFRISARLRDTTFRYLPPGLVGPAWPALTNLSGELVFDRRSMQVRQASAQVEGVRWQRIEARIGDLGWEPVLELQAQGRGPAQDALDYVARTPIAGWIDHRLDGLQGSGAVDLTLGLTVPLLEAARTRVRGGVRFEGNALRRMSDGLALADVTGDVAYSETGFDFRGVRGRLFGGPVRIDGGLQEGGALALTVQGSAAAAPLRDHAARQRWPDLLRTLLGRSEGEASYRLRLGLSEGRPVVQLDSDLSGWAIALPAPLRKPADQALPLQARWEPLRSAASSSWDRLALDLGDELSAAYVRDVSGSEPRVLQGAVRIGAGEVPMPDAGVRVGLSLPRLDLDAWRAALVGLGSPDASQDARAPSGPRAALAGYLPDTIGLYARELILTGRTLDGVVIGASRVGPTWRASVQAAQLDGYVEHRGSDDAGSVYARLSRLSLPPQEAQDVTALLREPPTTVPALDLVVDDMELGGRRLGRVEVQAVNQRTGAPARWRLTRLQVHNPDATLSAVGQWAPEPGAAPGEPLRLAMDFELRLNDAGQLLERLGIGRVARGGSGLVQGQIGWRGSPFALDTPTLSGAFGIEIKSGQFLKTEPGVARLLGILSLQALPRRLLLDFRDVFLEGFAFDAMVGDVRVADGVAHTNNLRISGVQAAVLMEGSADIVRETQALDVVVVPEINAGTASLAYAVINPAVGLGTFIAQLFLRAPLIKAATREYRVTGSWTDPQVEPLNRPATPAQAGPGAQSAP